MTALDAASEAFPLDASMPASRPAEALFELLPENRRYRAPDLLTLVPALSELATTLEGIADGRLAPQGDDRASLFADVDLALCCAGRGLGACTIPTLPDLRRAEASRGQLDAAFHDPAHAARTATVLRGVLVQLRSTECVGAAWDGLVAVADDPTVTVERCVLAAEQLQEIVRVRGHDWWYIEMAIRQQVRAGDLEAARGAAAAPCTDSAFVVWLAFGNADIADAYCRMGQVQFFSSKLPLESIRDGCPALARRGFDPAVELCGDGALEMFPSVEGEEHYVWARVELSGPNAHEPPGGRMEPPVEWARRFVQDIVQTATFARGGSEWVLLEGGWVFATPESHGGGASGFGRRDPSIDRTYGHPAYDPTSALIHEMPSEFADALARGETAARFAADEVKWHREAATTTDPAARLALHVRGFETQWVTGRNAEFETWHEAVSEYLRDTWAVQRVREQVGLAGRSLYAASRKPGAPAGLTAAAAEFQSMSGMTFLLNLPAVLRCAPRVVGDLTPGSMTRRYVKAIAASTRDGRAVQRWWEAELTRFDRLLKRAVRLRNNTIHGRTLTEDVARSVEPFIRQMSAWLVTDSIDAAIKGDEVREELARRRHADKARYAALSGTTWEGLFGPVP